LLKRPKKRAPLITPLKKRSGQESRAAAWALHSVSTSSLRSASTASTSSLRSASTASTASNAALKLTRHAALGLGPRGQSDPSCPPDASCPWCPSCPAEPWCPWCPSCSSCPPPRFSASRRSYRAASASVTLVIGPCIVFRKLGSSSLFILLYFFLQKKCKKMFSFLPPSCD
jgi:hypothetical protein